MYESSFDHARIIHTLKKQEKKKENIVVLMHNNWFSYRFIGISRECFFLERVFAVDPVCRVFQSRVDAKGL